MLRTPHRVTLLPYTTLFRSNTAGLIGYRAFGDAPRTGFPDQAGAGASALLGRYGVYAVQPTGGGDRKSTRLNSSHVKISYAVFCLKKKKNQNAIRTHEKRRL